LYKDFYLNKMTRKSSRKTQRSRNPVKRSRNPVKRSRKPVKFKMFRKLLKPSLLTRQRDSVLQRNPVLLPRNLVRPTGLTSSRYFPKDNIKNIWIDHYLDQIPLWVLQTVRTHPSQPYLSDKITKKNLATTIEKLSDNQVFKERFNKYLFEAVKNKFVKTS